MSSPQMIRTFGLSLTGWPFAVEAPKPSHPDQLTLSRTEHPAAILDPVPEATTGFWLAANAYRPLARAKRHFPIVGCRGRQVLDVSAILASLVAYSFTRTDETQQPSPTSL